MTNKPSRRAGKYETREEVDRGANAVVYKARPAPRAGQSPSWPLLSMLGAMVLLAMLAFGTGCSVPLPATPASPEPDNKGPVVITVTPPPAIPTPNVVASPTVEAAVGRTPSVSDSAPDFALKNLQGEEVRLSDFQGRPVLINFWATWCPPCRTEMPVIETAWQKYQDEGFVVLAVDVQESAGQVQHFVDSLGLTFPILLDSTAKVASEFYRIRAFPTSFFVGRDGRLVATHRGTMTEQVLQQYMGQVLATK